MRLNNKLLYVKFITFVFLPLMVCGCHSETTVSEKMQGGVRSVVSDALTAWQQSDWTTMYETLSLADKKLQTFQEFRNKRERLNKVQQLQNFRIVDVSRSGEREFIVNVDLELNENYNSGFRSDIEPRTSKSQVAWTVVKEGGAYRITFGGT